MLQHKITFYDRKVTIVPHVDICDASVGADIQLGLTGFAVFGGMSTGDLRAEDTGFVIDRAARRQS